VIDMAASARRELHLEGIVLTQTSATLRTGASINGRLLAQTAVNIDGSTVVEPPR
jgi:hypothetical protein